MDPQNNNFNFDMNATLIEWSTDFILRIRQTNNTFCLFVRHKDEGSQIMVSLCAFCMQTLC